MKSALHTQQQSTRRLTGLYLTALTVVALCAIGGQLLIQLSLSQLTGDAGVINIAGRQRMLSQSLTKAALALLVTNDTQGRAIRIKEIQTTLALWERSHQGLLQGDSQLGLSGNNSQTVQSLFLKIEPDYAAMDSAAKSLLNTINQEANQPTKTVNADILPFIQTLLTKEPIFLPGMDAIVSQYQVESEGRINLLKQVEMGLLGFTLVVLLAEGLLIFRPAVSRINKGVDDLVDAQKQVAMYTTELESKNNELELAFNEAIAAHRKVMPHARVVAYGHYQVQGTQGNYYTVMSREINGSLLLECECLMYRRNLICSHSLAAATLHSALLRQKQALPQRSTNPLTERRRELGS